MKSGYGRGEDLGAATKQVIWQAFGLPAPYGYRTFPRQAWLTEQLAEKLKECDYDSKSGLEESSDITVDVPHLPPPSAAHPPTPDQIPTLIKPSKFLTMSGRHANTSACQPLLGAMPLRIRKPVLSCNK